MKCPQCSARMLVSDTRSRNDGATRRRYFCPACNERLTTIERPVADDDAQSHLIEALLEIADICNAAITIQKETT